MDMNRTPKVWPVHDTGDHDLTPAERHGDLTVPLIAGRLEDDLLNAPALVQEITRRLGRMKRTDFLLAVGDPVAIGIACSVAAQRFGEFQILKWDKKQRRYFPILVKLEE